MSICTLNGQAMPKPETDLVVQRAMRAASELSDPLRDLPHGAMAGPVPYGGAFLFEGIRTWRPAPSDDQTLAAADRATSAAYMVEQKANAEIEWLWL